MRGRWIFPDFVYIDFSKSDYRVPDEDPPRETRDVDEWRVF
jgi:hypothetical protein